MAPPGARTGVGLSQPARAARADGARVRLAVAAAAGAGARSAAAAATATAQPPRAPVHARGPRAEPGRPAAFGRQSTMGLSLWGIWSLSVWLRGRRPGARQTEARPVSQSETRGGAVCSVTPGCCDDREGAVVNMTYGCVVRRHVPQAGRGAAGTPVAGLSQPMTRGRGERLGRLIHPQEYRLIGDLP